MQPGEEYLSVQLDAKEMLYQAMKAVQDGKEKIHTAAFRNADKTEGDNRPIFHSKTVAIWKATKQPEKQKTQEEKV